MKNLICKELRLATLPLTFIFILFSLMTFIPGYPILCGAFFFCLGIFQSYQSNRENNDILYSVLLPVGKTDIVKAKFSAAVILQSAAFFISMLCTVIRMLFLSDAKAYLTNALMGANFVFLAFFLLIFTAFNVIFIGGFFKTAHHVGKPFICFIVVNFIIIGIAEALHHLPGLAFLNTLDFGHFTAHICIFAAAAIIYLSATAAACKAAQKSFEKIDL